MKVYKDGMEREVPKSKLSEYISAGWKESNSVGNIVNTEELIVLQPTAKSKGAAKSLDNTINKGDE
jgi:hypothetical protein